MEPSAGSRGLFMKADAKRKSESKELLAMRRGSTSGLLFVGLCALASPALAVNHGPTPYLSFADSPFSSVALSYFHLEDFQDGSLNTPGVTVSAGAAPVAPGSTTDSVDGDDGAIDGSGAAGWSLYSNQVLTSFAFDFNAGALGNLPTHVGIVWTDVGFVTSGSPFSGPVTAEAFDSASNSLGLIGPVVLGGDGTVNGATAEDRFFGFSNLGGIARLVIATSNSVDWEVDHLQYGYTIPEPTAAVLASGALIALGAVRRRVRSTALY
jgi:hypothetical protein